MDAKQHTQALIERAKAHLIVMQPFFASVVLRRTIELSDRVPTAAVTPRGQIYINPTWVKERRLAVEHMSFLLCHEAMHFMLAHGVRTMGRNPRAWNIACDKVINDTLLDAEIGAPIEGGVYEAGARAYSAEALYDSDDAEGGDIGGAGTDIMDAAGMSEGERAEVEAQVRVEVAQAAKAAQMMGSMPEGLARLVEGVIHVPTPWYSLLERFMQAYRKDDLSWSRPNRRFIASGIYLPGRDNVPEMGEVVVAVDTSGSVDEELLQHFAGHVSRIVAECRPAKLHVVYCDAAVAHVDTFEAGEEPTFEAHGGGGTAFQPVFDWVAAQGVEPDVLVYLTDLMGPTPQRPPYDVVWLATSDASAPFGQRVQYNS